jgi:hypothetical protein
VTVYGLTAPLLARALGLSEPNPQGIVIVGAYEPARAIARALMHQDIPVLLLDEHHEPIAEAQQEGLPAHRSSIHDDHLLETLDLTGFGRLLALAPHNAVNVLAVHRFRSVFGRSRVYQLPLPPHPKDHGHASLDFGDLQVITAEHTIAPQVGETLICLVSHAVPHPPPRTIHLAGPSDR